MMRSVRFVASAVLLCVLLGPDSAAAQSDSPFDDLSDAQVEVALGLLDDAEAAEAAGDFGEALASYRALAQIVEVPQVRLREAAAMAGAGQLDGALELYLLLAALDNSPEVAEEAAAAADILVAENPASYEISVIPADALLSIDDGGPTAAPQGSHSGQLDIGTHTFVASSEGYETTEWTADVRIGEAYEHSATLVPTAVEPELVVTSDPTEPRSRGWVAPVVLGGSAVAAGALSAVFGIRAADREDAHNDDPRGDPDDRYADEARSAQRVSNGMTVAGATLGVAALVSAVVSARSGREDRVNVSAAMEPEGASLHLGWQWCLSEPRRRFFSPAPRAEALAEGWPSALPSLPSRFSWALASSIS